MQCRKEKENEYIYNKLLLLLLFFLVDCNFKKKKSEKKSYLYICNF